MNPHRILSIRLLLLIFLVLSLTLLATRLKADTGTCSGQTITLPFTDVMGNGFFCQIAEAYFSGLTNGTSGTTYSPTSPVPREQMAAFVTRTLDQSLKRGSPRAALGQWWTADDFVYALNDDSGGENPQYLACDGLTVWCSNTTSDNVSRIEIRTGHRIIITGIPQPEKIVIASGAVFVASFQSPGKIYAFSQFDTIDSTAFEGIATVGSNPVGITCDGRNLWTANVGTGPGTGSISRVTMQTFITTTTTFTVGFSQPLGILFDGANLWVTDAGQASLKRVDTNTGTVVQTISLSGAVGHPVFDGTNLWIPCTGPDQVYVVRAVGGLTGTILAQLAGNGLNGIKQAAFDGERILVPNNFGQTVSLWKASDLSPISSVSITSSFFNPRGVCSDGTSFFIGLKSTGSSHGFIHYF